jgi:sugar-specific transcriptional regulator TrmB
VSTARGSESRARELQDALVELGLTPNQSRVYLALLDGGPATAAEAAARAAVPRPKVYEALQSLERYGFCAARGDRVARYEAVPAEAALAEWVLRREHERRLAGERDEHLRSELVRTLPHPPDGRGAPPPPFMEALIGQPRVAEMFEQLVVSARRQLDIVMAEPIVQPRPRWNRLETEALARGVSVRVLYTTETARDPERYLALVRAGGQGRVTDRLVLKLALADGEQALIVLRDESARRAEITAVRVTHPDLVSPLQLLFGREWRRARPLGSAA